MRRIAIKCNLIGRDQGSFVAEAQKKIGSAGSPAAGIQYCLERSVRESATGNEAAFLYCSRQFHFNFCTVILDFPLDQERIPDCNECSLLADRWTDSLAVDRHPLERICGGWIHRAVRYCRAKRRNPAIPDQFAQARGYCRYMKLFCKALSVACVPW